MKDLNFFSAYSKRTEKRINKSNLIYGTALAISLVMIFLAAYNFIIIRRANKDLLESKQQVERFETNEKIKEIHEKEANVEELKESVSKLKTLDDYVREKDIINEGLLSTIRNAIPADLFLRNMVLNYDSIKIEGNSLAKEAIAQFQYNINNLDVFEEVFVPQISYNDNYYNFTMDIKFFEEEENHERKDEAKSKETKN